MLLLTASLEGPYGTDFRVSCAVSKVLQTFVEQAPPTEALIGMHCQQ